MIKSDGDSETSAPENQSLDSQAATDGTAYRVAYTADERASIERIRTDSSYLEADRDADFLREDPVRGVRLQIDYLKPELLLEEHGIDYTIVVFGSARISPPSVARALCRELNEALEKKPGDAELLRSLAIAIQIENKSQYYEMSREFGRIVGSSGMGPKDSRVTLMTGGGPGCMEAANRGANDVGAKSIGLNIALPHEQNPNPYITPGLAFSLHYFGMRKLHLLKRAKALVAFPGGYGTLDEFFETLTLVQTGKIDPVPIVLIGESFWSKAIDFDFLVDEGVINAGDRALFKYADTAQAAWDSILAWYAGRGEELVGIERRILGRRKQDQDDNQ
jgi:uncharacterized protein (TIGR00730 family)